MSTELIAAFVNTLRISRDHPAGRDELGAPADLERWWHAQTATEEPLDADEDDLVLARTVREGIRGLLATHNDAQEPGDADAVARLEVALPSLPLRTSTGTSIVTPVDGRPATTALTTIVGAMAVARAAGTWERIKVCRDPQCREAFVDSTKNRSRTWCSMQVCGARAKQRTFAERHR